MIMQIVILFPNRFSYQPGKPDRNIITEKREIGAFRQDRYHATAVETGEHLKKCIVYIDLNMVLQKD